MEPIELCRFRSRVRIALTIEQLHEAGARLNHHYLGDEIATEVDADGFIVSRYPERETDEYYDACLRINAFPAIPVAVVLLSDGSLRVTPIPDCESAPRDP